MRQALLLAVALLGCTKTVIVGPDGGAVAECGPGYTICEPAAALDGGDAEYPLTCANVLIDVNNCGACGESCGTRGCDAGRCGACHPLHGPCLSDADCCDGKCRLRTYCE